MQIFGFGNYQPVPVPAVPQPRNKNSAAAAIANTSKTEVQPQPLRAPPATGLLPPSNFPNKYMRSKPHINSL